MIPRRIRQILSSVCLLLPCVFASPTTNEDLSALWSDQRFTTESFYRKNRPQQHPIDAYGPPLDDFLNVNDSPPPPPPQTSSRIVNGFDADPIRDSYYVMHLRYNTANSSWHYGGCGASLISNCHVLTAAHCLADQRAGLLDGLLVRAYRPFQGHLNSGYSFHFAYPQNITLHPQFDNFYNRHDVAVIRMAQCTDEFTPVRLADASFDANDGLQVQALGFGALEEGASELPDTLQKVTLDYVTQPACAQIYPTLVFSEMVCTYGGTRDACVGDSGGPLSYEGPDATYQLGIVSWGVGCARLEMRGVYASVPHHIDWIRSMVCNDPELDPSLELCRFQALQQQQQCKPTDAPCTVHEECCSDRCGGLPGQTTRVCRAAGKSKASLSSGRGGGGGGSRGVRRRRPPT